MLNKQAVDVSFAQGLDQKTDPKRVQMGKFVSLQNTVFQKGGLLQKRNGYGLLPALPDTTYSYLTTFNNNLTAIGSNIAALNAGGAAWIQRGAIQPLTLDTLPLVRNNLNQTQCDSAVASNGLVCTVYLETDGSKITNKYVIADSVTGQNIVAPAVIPIASGAVSGGMRVFVLGAHFILVFTNTITATTHLQYVAVSTANPTIVGANTDIAASYVSAATLAWDGYVADNKLYLAYNTTSGGQQIKITYLTASLVLVSPASFATYKAMMMSLTADMTIPANPVIYLSFYRTDTSLGYTLAVDQNLNTLLAPQLVINGDGALNLASAAQNGVCTLFYEEPHTYSYDAAIHTNSIVSITITMVGPVIGSPVDIVKSVGLASKAFIVAGVLYFLAVYQSPYQPTYFLINGSDSTAASPVIAAKIAYQNGGGYLTTGLPGVNANGTTAQIPYLFKDLIQAVNKNTNVPSGSQVAGIYSQTGINLATIVIGTQNLDTAEIGNDLHVTGGFLWMYDGYLPVEHNFLLWPDSIEITTATGSGALVAQDYYYQVTYEWTDNQGNAFRSAPSIPVKQTTTTGSSTNTINVPTLRLTMKTANPVKIVVYRWSTAQQNYYQVTSISVPTLNSTITTDVAITDALSDASILGNNLLYTTGGVIEDVSAPSANALALFDTRLWLIDSENPDTLWFSKQVIPSTPVEMSDLLTIFVPPTTGTEVSTGHNRTLFPMDDKLIIGRSSALLYINGTGPDNTGSGNQYSPPIFITSTVGCANQASWVLTPNGLMFQSDKGIWLLDRGLATSYIGAPIEDFVLGNTVTSAVNVPETNQVRFTLSTGVILMYDYYYDQWGTFVGIPGEPLSSCIYQNLHSVINASGALFQETPGKYLDGTSPVLIQFKTGPLRLGDLQNYQRAYFFYILGDYISPHKLVCNLFYDYSKSPSQQAIVSPINYTPAYGSGPSPYGQESPYGGPGTLENFRVFLERQRCQAFAIQIQEIFDASFGAPAGAGLTLSGLNIIMGFKRGFRPQSAQTSTG